MPAFIVLNGGVMLAALAVAARLELQGSAGALGLRTLAGFLILIHSSVLLAGLLGHLTPAGLAIPVVGAAVVAGVAWTGGAAPGTPPGGNDAAPGTPATPLTPASLFAPLAAVATSAIWAWPHVREATRLWVWDDYTYHMVYPALWVRDHAIAAATPAQAFTMQAWYPLSASVVATWFMVPFAHAREEALAWVSLAGVFYAGLVIAGAATLSWRLRCRRGAWAVPVVLFATSQRTAIMASSFSDADLAQAACLFAALVSSVPRGESERRGEVWADAAYAGLLSGLALGIKISAAAPAMVVLLAMALRAGALRTPRVARARGIGAIALIFAAFWAATGGYWYARNVLYTGNPVYPAAFLAWPGATFPETTLREYGHRYGAPRALADAATVYLNWPPLHAWLALAGLVGLGAWLVARRSSVTRPKRYFACTALAVAASVLTLLPAAPFSAGNAMTFRSGFVHWDSMRYVAILLFLGWAALGVLVNAGAGAGRRPTLAAILIAAAGVMASGLPRLVPLLAATALLTAGVLARLPRSAMASLRLRAAVASAAALGGAALIIWSHDAKAAATRAALYGEPFFGAAAAVLDRQPPGTRLAVFGDQWVYPAFGDRLQLRPVRLDRDGDVATLPVADAMEPGELTVAPAVFRSRLAAAGVDVVVVVRQPHPGRSDVLPSQHAALAATGGELLYRDRAVAIWRVGARGATASRPE